VTDFDPETRRRFAAIQANWDARTPIHVASRFYDVGRKEPASWFADYEWADLGDLAGKDVLHLQCHLGTETAAFVERGARRVVGLDISGTAVAEARRLATAPIAYVRANVYDAPTALDGDRFDVVYTGKGALCYLPDLPRWAGVVAELLRPGGLLYLVEWAHGLGEVVNALIGAGFRIASLRESDEIPWPRWPGMVPTGTGFWRLPDDAPRIPLFYALAATRP
jgi:SAM-dependent methyltransferase